MSEFCSLGTHLHTPERLPCVCIGKKELFVASRYDDAEAPRNRIDKLNAVLIDDRP